MADAGQFLIGPTSDRSDRLTAADLLGRLAQEKSWGSATTRNCSVAAVDGARRVVLTDLGGNRSQSNLQLGPSRSRVDERLPDALSVITHRARSLDSVLIRLGGRRDRISFAEALGFLQRGVHGVIRWHA